MKFTFLRLLKFQNHLPAVPFLDRGEGFDGFATITTAPPVKRDSDLTESFYVSQIFVPTGRCFIPD